jgi:hypothetical protein
MFEELRFLYGDRLLSVSAVIHLIFNADTGMDPHRRGTHGRTRSQQLRAGVPVNSASGCLARCARKFGSSTPVSRLTLFVASTRQQRTQQYARILVVGLGEGTATSLALRH